MTRKVVGSGITAREVSEIPSEKLASHIRQASDFVRQEGFFEFAARPWAEGCRDTLEGVDPEREFEDDHPVDFARRILNAYEVARLHIENGDADKAARWAFLAGHLAGLAQLKFEWEDHALRGRDTLQAAREGGEKRGADRRDDAASRYRAWQCMADDLWSRRPDHTKANVARAIAASTGENADTIRRRIKRPK